jgi:hypothetical protein
MATIPTGYEILCYGRPDVGGIIAGGSWASTLALVEWSDDRGLRSVGLDAKIAIKDTATPPAVSIHEDLVDALNVQSGNLSLCVPVFDGANTGGNCALLEIDAVGKPGLLRLTPSSGPGITAADIGKAILVKSGSTSVGYAQIVGIDSAATGIGYIWVHPSQGATPTTATSAAYDICKALVLFADNQYEDGTTLQPVLRGGMMGRVSCEYSGSDDDDPTRRLLDFAAGYEAVASDRRVDDSNRQFVRASSISRTLSMSGLSTITFNAEVTAGITGGAPTLAPAILDAFWSTWTAAVLDDLVVGADWQDVSARVESMPDERRLVRVSQTFREKQFPDLEGITNDPRIKGAEVTFRRSTLNVHGLRGGRTPFTVTASWSGSVTAKGVSAVSYDKLVEFWGKNVKPFLIARAKAIYGGTPVNYGGEDPVIDPLTNQASGSILLWIIGSGTNVYSYSRLTQMRLVENIEDDEIHDGEDFTFVSWKGRGRALVGSVSISVLQIGPPQRIQKRGGQIPGLLRFTGLTGSGSKTIGLPLSGGRGQIEDSGGNKITVYPDPGDPGILFPDLSGNSGSWRVRGRIASTTPKYIGEDPDGAGAAVKITTTNYSGQYLWKRGTKTDQLRPKRIPTRIGGSGSEGVGAHSKAPEKPAGT